MTCSWNNTRDCPSVFQRLVIVCLKSLVPTMEDRDIVGKRRLRNE